MNLAKEEITFRSKEGVMFVLFIMGFMFTVLGFATPSWTKIISSVSGLWESGILSSHGNNVPGALVAVQFFMCMALIWLVIVVVWLTMYVFGLRLGRNPMSVVTGNGYAAAIFLFLGVTIYGAEYSQGLSYSFIFAIFGLLFTAAGALVGSAWVYQDQQTRRNVLVQVQPTQGQMHVQTVDGQVLPNQGYNNVVEGLVQFTVVPGQAAQQPPPNQDIIMGVPPNQAQPVNGQPYSPPAYVEQKA